MKRGPLCVWSLDLVMGFRSRYGNMILPDYLHFFLQGDAPLGKSEVKNLYAGHPVYLDTWGVFNFMSEQHKEVFSSMMAAPIGWSLLKVVSHYRLLFLAIMRDFLDRSMALVGGGKLRRSE